MSFRAIQSAFAIIASTPELKPCASITLLVLADCHNQETGRCDPSIETIAKRGSISPRSVQNGLAQLIELKKISVTYRQAATGKGKKNLTSRYRIGGAKSASTLPQNLHPNQEYRHAPSAFDDLAMLLDDFEGPIPSNGGRHA